MDFQYNDEQKLLADSVERWLREKYSFETWRKLVATEQGFAPANWAEMAELGWLGVAVPEGMGGLGGGAVEQMIIMEGLGWGLVAEPYLWTAVVGKSLLELAGNPAQQALLAGLAEGKLQLAFAFAEPQARYDLHDVATTAKADGAGFMLSGKKIVVGNAATADWLVVVARTSGDQRDKSGISLFLVAANAPGVQRRDYRTVDHRRASDVTFDGVTLGADDVLGPKDAALPIVEEVADRAMAAMCAEAVGCMTVLHRDTLAYTKQRKQFGRAIADFQVLQHRMVDMMIALEQAKTMAIVANLKLGAAPKERARAVAAAKVQIGRSGRFVGQQAVQLHGGMGMSDELPVGHYMKRLMIIDTLFGSADHHQKRFASM